DPMPELTALHKKLIAAAWEDLEPRLPAEKLPEPEVDVRWLPAAEIDYAGPNQKSLKELMFGLDALDADSMKLAVYRYYAPDNSDGRLNRDLKMPGGLYVERARGAATPILRRGDVILAAAGEAATG